MWLGLSRQRKQHLRSDAPRSEPIGFSEARKCVATHARLQQAGCNLHQIGGPVATYVVNQRRVGRQRCFVRAPSNGTADWRGVPVLDYDLHIRPQPQAFHTPTTSRVIQRT